MMPYVQYSSNRITSDCCTLKYYIHTIFLSVIPQVAFYHCYSIFAALYFDTFKIVLCVYISSSVEPSVPNFMSCALVVH